MVLTVTVPLQQAQALKKYLLTNNLLVPGYQYTKTTTTISFPVKKRFEYENAIFEDQELTTIQKQPSFREACKEQLTKKEYEQGRFSYDTVGTIAIIEVPEELEEKELLLANTLLKTDNKIKTVLKKTSGHVGELRQQHMMFLAGVKTKETTVYENGIKLYIHVEDVYYSIRLGTERNRIMKLVQEGERVLCMFSGAAPYPIVFAKNTPAKEIIGVELNKKGHELGLRNLELNKVTNVTLYCGDVNEVVPTLEGLFDRITMPLPHTGEEFLEVALNKLRTGGTIHYYTFIDKENITTEQERIEELIQAHDKKIVSITPVLCGQHSPRRYRICYDIIIE